MSAPHDESSVWDEIYHTSTTLEDSKQWYEKQIAMQMEKGGLFEDQFLPAGPEGLGDRLVARGREYHWLRPHEMMSDPEFITDGISRFDIKQGEVGNCWFLASVSCLAMYEELLQEVMPEGQSFDSDGGSYPYCGMFWFRFWRFGHWVDVVVDDRLPTRGKRLVFLHSQDRKEFWSALFEKAYVKLAGNYSAMYGGAITEAMVDFTGGLGESMQLGNEAPPQLFQMMQIALQRTSLMACLIQATGQEVGSEGPHGLINWHAYTVTDARQVSTNEGDIELVRLRNPWGNEREWTGPWGDKSSEWTSLSPDEQERLNLTFENDGEFWMSFEDFNRYFTKLDFCHLGPASGYYGNQSILEKDRRRWEMSQHEGEWVSDSTAGGCRSNKETFHTNPQFRIHVIDPDETDDDDCGTIIVGLMQKRRIKGNKTMQMIGYSIYKLENPHEGPLDKEFFLSTRSAFTTPQFNTVREITHRHKLLPGEYVIVPSTYAPNKEGQFVLRVFSERPCPSD